VIKKLYAAKDISSTKCQLNKEFFKQLRNYIPTGFEIPSLDKVLRFVTETEIYAK